MVTDVDLDLVRGERVLCLGRSGAGKSSLALVLGGLISPTAGAVEIDGISPHDRSSRRSIAGRVAFLFQNPETQLLTSRVWDEIAFSLENLGWPQARIGPRVAALLAALDLEPLAERESRTLSGGEMQRVALAAALAPGAPYLFLDEPVAHLDPPSAVQIEKGIQSVTGDSSVLRLDLAPFPPATVPSQVDRMIVIEMGRVIHQGRGLPAGLARRLLGEDEPYGVEPLAELSPWPGPTVLRTRCLTGGWGKQVWGKQGPQAVFHDVDLELRPGTVVHLQGRSGAGKSTLLLTLAGLIPPLAGTVAVEPRAPLRDRVSCVPQFAERLFYRSSVKEELIEYSGQSESGAGPGPITRALELVRLPPAVLDRPPLALSSGEVRRLALAASLVSRRPVLLLDEPGAGLDGPGLRMLERLVRSFAAEGGTVVVAGHGDELQGIADERWLLAEGRLERARTAKASDSRAGVRTEETSAPGSTRRW